MNAWICVFPIILIFRDLLLVTIEADVVARDGIEPPTQAFSGLVLPELRYVALEKSRLLNFNANKNWPECAHIVPKKYDTIYILKNYE